MSALILEAGNVLTLTGSPPSDGVNVANGTLIYGANQSDTSVAYLKGEGGEVQIAAGVTLESTSCTFNGGAIADDTTGAEYYVDSIGEAGDWVVDGDVPTPTTVTDTGYVAMATMMTVLGFRRY